MEIKIKFNLEDNSIPLDYRRIFISFIKKSIESYSEKAYASLFEEEENKRKPYTFSIYLPLKKIDGEKIILKDNFVIMNFSISDMYLGVKMFQGFLNFKEKDFNYKDLSLKITEVALKPERQINTNKISIKFESPMVIQKHSYDSDFFFSYLHKGYSDVLKEIIKNQIESMGLDYSLDGFEIIKKRPKKTVVRFYEKQIECSLGEFMLKGDKDLLKWLHVSGMGSKTSSGFGKFKVL